MLYACMAIGQSLRRHKKGMAVLFFFLFYILLQVVGVWVLSGVFEHLAANESVLYSSAAILEMTNGILWRFTAVAAVTGVVFYVITHIMLAKRLNLQ